MRLSVRFISEQKIPKESWVFISIAMGAGCLIGLKFELLLFVT
jgi:hypothetical protein